MLKVLIADDNRPRVPLIKELVEKILGIPLDVRAAYSYAELIGHRKTKYDLLLLDNKLGDGLSSDFISVYTANFPDSYPPVLYSSLPTDAKCSDGTICVDYDNLDAEIEKFKSYTGTVVMEEDQMVKPKSNILRKIGITSGISLVTIAVFLKVSAQWVCDTTINPHIQAVADASESHAKIRSDITCIQMKQAKNDTTLLYIKNLLDQMASNDQKVKARNAMDEERIWR